MTPADRESGNAEWRYQVVDGGGVISRQCAEAALHCTDCTAALCRAAGRKDYNVHSANKHIDTIDRYTATGDSCAML